MELWLSDGQLGHLTLHPVGRERRSSEGRLVRLRSPRSPWAVAASTLLHFPFLYFKQGSQ